MRPRFGCACLLVALVVTACSDQATTATQTPPGPVSPASDAAAPAADVQAFVGDALPGDAPALPPDAACPAAMARLVPLSPDGYAAELARVTGLTVASSRLIGAGANQTFTPALAEVLAQIAREAAEQALRGASAERLCTANSTLADDCPVRFVEDWGARLFRRALTASERDELAALFRQAAARFGRPRAAPLTLEVMLQAPEFLYLTITSCAAGAQP